MKRGATPGGESKRRRVQAVTPEVASQRRRRWLRVRVGVLGVLLLVGAGFVVNRAYELQVVRSPELRELAESQYLRNIRLSPKRGTIYDRHGAELAVSVDGDSVWANPRALRANGGEPEAVAARLATLLDIDVERIERRLASQRYFVWIKRRVTPRQAAAVRSLDLPGVHIQQESRRYYPNRELASHLLGFANVDGVGIEGLELALEEHLRGSSQTVPAIRDRRGDIVFSQQLLDDRATQGDDVTLTIDKTIQRIAERELSLAVRTFEARAGHVVVMDPRTGELLALANYPTFNPNEPARAPTSHRRNRAITDRYEPGSTVKPFTIAAALARGAVSPGQLIDCEGGALQVDEYTIHDSHPYDLLTPAQILAHSSNIGTAKIGFALGRRGLYRALRRFGFGQETGVPLPGEVGGSLRHYRRWYEMDAATIAFGQGMSVTTLQLATAMSAVANGGRLMHPVLIRRITDVEGDLVEETLPRVRRQVVPTATARLVADMMTAVTGPGGTGQEASIDGYLVAGKTGTAQKADSVNGGYADDRWVASFVGFVPADRPRLVIAVTVDEPIIAHYGGQVAGPVFRRVGEAALRHLGVPGAGGRNALARHVRERRQSSEEAETPDPGSEVDAITAPIVEPGAGEVRVPALEGHGARYAVRVLREAGLMPTLEGSGLVIAQVPEGGDIVAQGAAVRVVLAPPVVSEGMPEAEGGDEEPAVEPGEGESG